MRDWLAGKCLRPLPASSEMKTVFVIRNWFGLLVTLFSCCSVVATPVKVELIRTGDHWELRRAGKPLTEAARLARTVIRPPETAAAHFENSFSR